MSGKRSYEPDWKGGAAPGTPKPAKETRAERRSRTGRGRKLDSTARDRKLASDPTCRATGKRATEGHHILLRSQGGDDVEDNILPLSLRPHHDYHATGRLPGVKLTEAEMAYLVSKLGQAGAEDYVMRKFGNTGKVQNEQSAQDEGGEMANKRNPLDEATEAKLLKVITEEQFGENTKAAQSYGRKALKVAAGLRTSDPSLGSLPGEQADLVLELLKLPQRKSRQRATAAA